MYILIAEMLLALGVIIFIFWWTMSARIDRPGEPDQGADAEAKKERLNLNRQSADSTVSSEMAANHKAPGASEDDPPNSSKS